MRLGTSLGTLTRALIAGGLLFLVTVLTYLPALDGKFIWDDDGHVTTHSLRSLTGLSRIWTDPRATQQYYPLTHSAFWLEYQLWGVNPVGYHLSTQGKYPEAMAAWQRAAGLDPNSAAGRAAQANIEIVRARLAR